jgi:hypothetical protein
MAYPLRNPAPLTWLTATPSENPLLRANEAPPILSRGSARKA